MTQLQKAEGLSTKPQTKNHDPLAGVRTAAQELHGAISDAAAKSGAEMKSELQTIPKKAKAAAASVKESLVAQSEPVKKQLADAIKYLEATEKHVVESLKATGEAFEASFRHALVDARTAVLKVSEAIAAKRTAEALQPRH